MIECKCDCVVELTPEEEVLIEQKVGRNGIVRMRGEAIDVIMCIVRKSISNTRNQQQ